jgi:large subunit ribosomal protein L10
MAIRRELAIALHKVDSERVKNGGQEDLYADQIRFQIIQTGIFASALRVVEFFNPKDSTMDYAQHPTDPATPTSAQIPNTTNSPDDKRFTHGLSRRAWEAASNRKLTTELDPLLSGPLAIVAFPSVSPQYLKTVISILAPSKEFPAPKRKVNPDYHEPAVQYGLQKLMLLGARVEGRVFDADGTKWVGGIDGGIDGLRAQLVHALEGIGGSLAGALEGAGRSLWVTVESRRMDMEEKEGSGKEKKKEE